MGGYVYVVGGENKEGLLTDVERLEPVTGIWKHCNGLMFPRHCHTAALVSGPVCEKYIDTKNRVVSRNVSKHANTP